MAIYHKATSHPDMTAKRAITGNDITTLEQLQFLMNTQDTMGNADPRFWVIKGSKVVPTDSGHADRTELVDEDGETVAESVPEALKYLCEQLSEQIEDGNLPDIKTIEMDDADQPTELIVTYINGTVEHNDVTDMLDITALADLSYTLQDVVVQDFIYPDTLFLTVDDAVAHLRAKAHNYDASAHAYAMTAVGSHRVSALWSLIQTLDFKALRQLLATNDIAKEVTHNADAT